MKIFAKQFHILILILFSFILKAIGANTNQNVSKCFDILDLYNRKQIETIYKLSFENVANTSPANKMFECYLENTRREGIISDAEKYFHVYKKCTEYKKEKLTFIDTRHIDELELLGIPLYLENHVRERITNGQGYANDILKYIQDELGKKIEMMEEYENYRRLVYAKLKEHQKSGQQSLYSWGVIKVSVLMVVMIIFF